MSAVALIFPNQLFKDHPVVREGVEKVLLIEDSLFFGDSQYPLTYHKQKLAYHRATMAYFSRRLIQAGFDVEIVPYQTRSTLTAVCNKLKQEGRTQLFTVEITDFLLKKRLNLAAEQANLKLFTWPDPGFINSSKDNRDWRSGRKRWFMADFYQWQRKRLDILMVDGKPAGGQWSFDEENRKKIPQKHIHAIPSLPDIKKDEIIQTAIASVENEFGENLGSLVHWYYPTSHQQAELWLENFLTTRFANFGPYEDAIVAGQPWLYHSILTPLMNVGLLTPGQVVEQTLTFVKTHDIPLNSVEGFIRQIIGWREFMRATYDDLSVPMRTGNHWGHKNAMPASFYTATTGIAPIDDVITRILDTGYCHHIERLMILGGFMFLCEIHPDEIYRWFMEMFIDSYDWVMVPNVYAMSQHACGGTITTKPYFSGSNYVLKMSNFKKGEWSVIWDGLFWRWIIKNKEALAGNPRWAMMVRNAEKMDEEKRKAHLEVAESYLKHL